MNLLLDQLGCRSTKGASLKEIGRTLNLTEATVKVAFIEVECGYAPPTELLTRKPGDPSTAFPETPRDLIEPEGGL